MVLWLVERFAVFSHMIRLLSGARGRKIQEPGEKIPLSEEEKNGFFFKIIVYALVQSLLLNVCLLLQGGALRCVQRNTLQCVEQTEKPTVTSVPWNHWPVKKTKLSLYLTVVNVAVSLK